MDCERTRTALSAQLDGEAIDAPPEAVTAHLAGCPACRAFQAETRRCTAHDPPCPRAAGPRSHRAVLQAIGADDRAGDSPHLDAWRIGLALIALVQIALGLPALLFGSDAGLPVHAARHLGSFDDRARRRLPVRRLAPEPGQGPVPGRGRARRLPLRDVGHRRGERPHRSARRAVARHRAGRAGPALARRPRVIGRRVGAGVPRRPRGRMSVRRVLGVLALAGGLVLLVAAPASAHAELVRRIRRRARSSRSHRSTITLNFSEVVSVENGAVRVFNANADRVDNGGVEESGSTVRLARAHPGQGLVRRDVASHVGGLAPGERRVHVPGRDERRGRRDEPRGDRAREPSAQRAGWRQDHRGRARRRALGGLRRAWPC